MTTINSGGKEVKKPALGNPYTKDLTDKATKISNVVFDGIDSLKRVHAAKTIEESGMCKSKLLQLLGEHPPEPLHDDEAYLSHPDFKRKGVAGNLSPLNNV